MRPARFQLGLILSTPILACGLGCGQRAPNAAPEGRPAKPAPAAPVEPVQLSEGGELLLKAHEAYRKLKSYSGSIDVYAAAHYPYDTVRDRRRYFVDYEAPDRLRFEGMTTEGEPLWIVARGKSFKDGPKPYGIRLERKAHQILRTHRRDTLQASSFLPTLLLGTPWFEKAWHDHSAFVSAFIEESRKKGTIILDDHECHEVECVRPNGTWNFAVDKANFLVRQIKESYTARQMRADLDGSRYLVHAGEVIQVFHIDSINAPLDPSLFKID